MLADRPEPIARPAQRAQAECALARFAFRAALAVLLLLALAAPRDLAAQGRDPSALRTEIEETARQLPSLRLGDVPREVAAVDAPFFSRDPLGFDASAPAHAWEELATALRSANDHLTASLDDGPSAIAGVVIPPILLLLLLLVALVQDVRLHRAAVRWSAALPGRDEHPPWLNAVRASLVRSAGRIAVPAALWGLSWFPLRGLLAPSIWGELLTALLAMLVAYRAVATGAIELFGQLLTHVDPTSRARLVRISLAAARIVFAFAAADVAVHALAASPDLVALSDFSFRMASAFASTLLIWNRRLLLEVLPAEGGPRYLAFRATAARWLLAILIASAVLMLMGALGFRRAASTILLRSYAIIGLLTLYALFGRFLDGRWHRSQADAPTLLRVLLRQIDAFARFCIAVVVGVVILDLLGLWNPMRELLQIPLFFVGETAITPYNLIKGVVFVACAVLLSRGARAALGEWVYPRFGIPEGRGFAANTALHYAVLVLGLGMALVTVGIDLSALAVFAGAIGIGIGFGLQDIARNLLSGFVLLFGRSVQVGDLVTVGDTWFGRVSDIGARRVTVVTSDNVELVIPSSQLIAGTIVNWTHSSPWVRIRIPVAMPYDADVSLVRDALLDAASRFDMLAQDRPAEVWLPSFGTSALQFELLVWFDATRHHRDTVNGLIRFHIWDALRERGLRIPYQRADLHIRTLADAPPLPERPRPAELGDGGSIPLPPATGATPPRSASP